MPEFSLNYSDRLRSDGVEVTIQVDEVDENAMLDIAAKLIEQVPELDALRSIDGYLAAFEPKGMDWRPNVKFEIAFAKLLTGDRDGGRRMLDELLELPVISPLLLEVQAQARRIADASSLGSAALAQLAAEIEENNLSVLFPGLRKTA